MQKKVFLNHRKTSKCCKTLNILIQCYTLLLLLFIVEKRKVLLRKLGNIYVLRNICALFRPTDKHWIFFRLQVIYEIVYLFAI